MNVETLNLDDSTMTRLKFAKLQRNMVQDLLKSKKESYVYKKYTVDSITKMLSNPDSNETSLRDMSRFLFLTSTHYRRLNSHFAYLPTFNYFISPTNLPEKMTSSAKKEYKRNYISTIGDFEKYNIKTEVPKMMIHALVDGVFCGMIYETDDSFYIKQFPVNYSKIEYVEDGCWRFSIDLDYFATKTYLLEFYGKEIMKAYTKYKGDKEKGIAGDKTQRYFVPDNGICIKCDDNPLLSLPYFCGLFKEILDLEDYRLLAKAKTESDNYKVLAMKMDTDDDGVPKMQYSDAYVYYEQAAANLPDGIGLIMSPFKVDDFSFDRSNVSDTDAVNKAENSFWSGAGVSPLIFGSANATSSSSLLLSVKPDAQISFNLLEQVARNFNRIQKLKKYKYSFEIKFLHQSIFDDKDTSDVLLKAATYGVSGAKSAYAASVGMSPSDVYNMAFLEDEILGLGVSTFNKPLVSSHTQSNPSNNESGRPTNASQGKGLTDSGEQTAEDGENKNK